MPAPLDLTGNRYGKLVAIWPTRVEGVRKWFCRCDCGETVTVVTDNLRRGNSKACGKCRGPNENAKKHGHKRQDRVSGTYSSWSSMKARILKNKSGYGKLDIDPRWMEFENFLSDMGERPAGKTLDRIDNATGYWPANCRWATPTEQTRNRKCARTIRYDGSDMPIAEVADILGVPYQQLYDRHFRGRDNATEIC